MLSGWTKEKRVSFPKMCPGEDTFYFMKFVKWQRSWKNINFLFSCPYLKKDWVHSIYQHNTSTFAVQWLYACYWNLYYKVDLQVFGSFNKNPRKQKLSEQSNIFCSSVLSWYILFLPFLGNVTKYCNCVTPWWAIKDWLGE